jgi:hypothetical protein
MYLVVLFYNFYFRPSNSLFRFWNLCRDDFGGITTTDCFFDVVRGGRKWGIIWHKLKLLM